MSGRPVHDDFESFLADWLADEAAGNPGYLRDALQRVGETRQRRARATFERRLPMLLTHRPMRASPARPAWLMPALGLVAAALVAITVIVAAMLLRPPGPDRFNSALLVPSLELDSAWDATAIPGLSQPSGIDVGPDGNLYLVNAGKSEVVVLAPDGSVLRRWGSQGAGPGQFYFLQDSQVASTTIGGIAVAADGSVYVADAANARVQQFTSEGEYVRQWGSFGPGDGRFLRPFDLAIGPDGDVYVDDFVRDDIQRFTPDGVHVATIGSHGTGRGQLSDTGGIAIAPDGTLVNADFGNDRLQAWSPGGEPAWSMREVPGAGPLHQPGGVALGAGGFTYVTEADRLLVLAPDRTLASSWMLPAGSASEEWLPIAIADDGTVYLSAEWGGIVYKLRSSDQERTTTPSAVPATAAPSADPTAVPAPSASPVPDGLVVGDAFAVPFTADQPQGWTVNWLEGPGGVELAYPRRDGTTGINAAVRVFVPQNAYADPCHSGNGPMDPPVGPTVDDLVAALTNLPGVLVQSPVTDVTIDGYHGKAFDLEATQILDDCPDDGPWLPMWTFDQGGSQGVSGPGSNFRQNISILDVDGTRVLVEVWNFDGSPSTIVADSFRVRDSIDFR